MTLSRAFAACAAVTLLGTAAPSTVEGQEPPVSAAPMSQQQINEEMLKELRQIRQLLERLTQPQGPPQPTTARLTNLTGIAMGRSDAPLTMVEFTDLQCPFCRQFATTTFDLLKRDWIDTGKLRYISRDYPLDFHPQAMPAARAARCAGEQGKYWELRLTLVRNAHLLSAAYITRAAAELKLDMNAYDACVASKKFDAQIEADFAEGTKIGITGTPTFVVGRTSGATLEGPMIVGALPYAAFDAKLKSLLETGK